MVAFVCDCMQAIIMCAGKGTRMRPLTDTTPKPLLKINGKPILQHLFESLPSEVDEVILIVGYLHQQIEDYFGSTFNSKKIIYVRQAMLTGTFTAVESCKPFLRNEPFLVLNGDDLLSPQTIETAVQKKQLCVVASISKNPERFGVIELNPDHTMKFLVEKPEKPLSNCVYTGASILDLSIFDFEPTPHPSGERLLAVSIGLLAQKTPVHVLIAEWWLPIGYPEHIKEAEDFLDKNN